MDRNELAAEVERIAQDQPHKYYTDALLEAAATLRQSAWRPMSEDEELRRDAERWRAVRELDGGAIYAVLGDCDGVHPEQADAAADALKYRPDDDTKRGAEG